MSASAAKQAAKETIECVKSLGIQCLYVVDAAIYKQLTGHKKALPYLAIPCVLKSTEAECHVVYGINPSRLFYTPALKPDFDRSYHVAREIIKGNVFDVIPEDLSSRVTRYKESWEIRDKLEELLLEPELSLDIEAFSLKFYKAGIGTFALAPDTQKAYAFACDKQAIDGKELRVTNLVVRELLRSFLVRYKGVLKYHNGSYDMKVLIYVLFMQEKLENFKGMLEGLNVLTDGFCFEDTKIITYLATNSVAGNELSLKRQAQEFAGNYGLGDDIKNISKVNVDRLLNYNGIDCLNTNYVFEKYYQTMIDDQQNDIYQNLFKKSIKLFLQAELTGIPISLAKVHEAEKTLQAARQEQMDILYNNPEVLMYEPMLQEYMAEKHTAKLKEKVIDPSHYAHVRYNPSSGKQTAQLLFEVGGLQFEDTTETGAPSTGKDALIKVKALNFDNKPYVEIIDALIELSQIDILLQNFIESFKENSVERKGMGHFLFGSFNLGGTISGRLSSSDPKIWAS